MEIKRISISPEIQRRLETIKSKIPPDILAILEALHENGVYIGIHGGGITHELGPNSDIDLAVIPSEFSPDFIVYLLSQVYSNGRQPPVPLEELRNLIQAYAPKVDYISLKVPTGRNPLSLHIEDPNFRREYEARKVARELRVPPKKTGVNIYSEVGIDSGQNFVVLRVVGGQTLLPGKKAAINSLHTIQIVDPNNPSPHFIIEDLTSNPSLLFILGLEANKCISEVNLFSPDSLREEHIIPPITSFEQLAEFLDITPYEAGRLYTHAYSQLLFFRKKVDYSPDELIQTLPTLRAALEYAESL